MVPLAQLWLPIILGAVAVFIASSLVHMVFKWHNSDFAALPNEEEVRAAIRRGAPAPGIYMTPYITDMKDCGKPEVQARFTEGPVAMVTVRPSGMPQMGPALGQWFMLNLVISLFVGYLCAHTFAPGAEYLAVFRVAGAVSFLAYGMGAVSDGIWMGRPWGVVMKDLGDALIYCLVTAGVFGSLWPAAS